MALPAKTEADLNNILVRELATMYRHEVFLLFGKNPPMKPPSIMMDDKVALGTWFPGERVIRINRKFVLEQSWGVVVEVMKHELAHQYVSEVLQIGEEETAHGPAFREVCERFGIDPAAAGILDTHTVTTIDHVTDRIKKLLRLAESGNEHEAQAAADAARRLMLKHNIEQVEKNETRGYIVRHIGGWTGKRTLYRRKLAGMLSESFFVETIWIHSFNVKTLKWGMELEIAGTPENVAVATYVHEFVRQEIDRLWKEAGLKGKYRQSFNAGVVEGLRESLRKEKRVEQEKGIVWVGDPGLAAFQKARHQTIHHGRYTANVNEGYHHGKSAGATIQIRKAVGESGVGPRLLPAYLPLPTLPTVM